MSFGMILLLVLAVLLLFGVLQRVCDRMRLNDKQALVFVAAVFVGGVIPDIRIGESFAFNIGGALLPLGLCVYLLIRAGTGWERFRAILASVITAAVIYAFDLFLPSEAEQLPMDVQYLYGIAAGVVAYLFGRSRRSAFVAGVLGVLLANTASAVTAAVQGYPFQLRLGGAGAFDTVVIAGVLAVMLAELMGELYERIVRKREAQHERGEDRI